MQSSHILLAIVLISITNISAMPDQKQQPLPSAEAKPVFEGPQLKPVEVASPAPKAVEKKKGQRSISSLSTMIGASVGNTSLLAKPSQEESDMPAPTRADSSDVGQGTLTSQLITQEDDLPKAIETEEDQHSPKVIETEDVDVRSAADQQELDENGEASVVRGASPSRRGFSTRAINAMRRMAGRSAPRGSDSPVVARAVQSEDPSYDRSAHQSRESSVARSDTEDAHHTVLEKVKGYAEKFNLKQYLQSFHRVSSGEIIVMDENNIYLWIPPSTVLNIHNTLFQSIGHAKPVIENDATVNGDVIAMKLYHCNRAESSLRARVANIDISDTSVLNLVEDSDLKYLNININDIEPTHRYHPVSMIFPYSSLLFSIHNKERISLESLAGMYLSDVISSSGHDLAHHLQDHIDDRTEEILVCVLYNQASKEFRTNLLIPISSHRSIQKSLVKEKKLILLTSTMGRDGDQISVHDYTDQISKDAFQHMLSDAISVTQVNPIYPYRHRHYFDYDITNLNNLSFYDVFIYNSNARYEYHATRSNINYFRMSEDERRYILALAQNPMNNSEELVRVLYPFYQTKVRTAKTDQERNNAFKGFWYSIYRGVDKSPLSIVFSRNSLKDAAKQPTIPEHLRFSLAIAEGEIPTSFDPSRTDTIPDEVSVYDIDIDYKFLPILDLPKQSHKDYIRLSDIYNIFSKTRNINEILMNLHHIGLPLQHVNLKPQEEKSSRFRAHVHFSVMVHALSPSFRIMDSMLPVHREDVKNILNLIINRLKIEKIVRPNSQVLTQGHRALLISLADFIQKSCGVYKSHPSLMSYKEFKIEK